MAWLLAFAVVLTLGVVGIVAILTCMAVHERGRWHNSTGRAQRSSVEAKEVNEPADCVQVWLDNEWDRKFGRGVTDGSDAVEG